MNKFFIHESNLERLEKKINAIRNKCIKNNVAFTYRQTGVEEFRKVVPEDENQLPYIGRFVEVEVEGSMKYNGWRFVAVLDHHDNGNVVRAFDEELTIPDMYFTCGPTCDHCNKIRSRKDTYLIYNDEAQEFKHVGKSCMLEYTNGLDAEEVARYISMFDEMIKGEYFGGSGYKSYMNVKEVLGFAFECYKHFGYEKAYYDEWDNQPKRSTRSRVTDYLRVTQGKTAFMSAKEIEAIKEEMASVNFNPSSKYAVTTSAAAIDWITSENTEGNAYLNNLKVIASQDWSDWKDLGILVSLTITYDRHLGQVAAYEKKQKEIADTKEREAASEFQGEVGQRITIPQVLNFKCVSCFENMYGCTWLYRWNDANNNVYTWFASSPVGEEDEVTSVVGTVKKHEEYNGVKQTVLTRCKCTLTNKSVSA